MVQCKFKVYEKAEILAYNGAKPIKVKLSAVQGEPFGSATPTGTIEMVICNEEAAKQFEVGKDYIVNFTLAE